MYQSTDMAISNIYKYHNLKQHKISATGIANVAESIIVVEECKAMQRNADVPTTTIFVQSRFTHNVIISFTL